jgi:fructose-specific phosphotransferase system IIC component
LGIAQLVGALARRVGGASFALDVIINGFLVGVFVVFFNFARQGKKWAFRAGMILYALDGLLMLLLRAYLGVAFHAFALFWMNGGVVAISKLRELERASSPSGGQAQ